MASTSVLTSVAQPSTRGHHPAGHALRRGLSLVEMLIVLAVSTLLLGGALSMSRDLLQGQRLQAAAALLETDIHLARSAAIRSGRSVRLVTQALTGGGSCYLVHTGETGSCSCGATGVARCEGSAELLRVEVQQAGSGITLAALPRPLAFDGRKGTVTPTATLRLSSDDGRSIHQVVNIMGRVRSCTSSGGVPGLRSCG